MMKYALNHSWKFSSWWMAFRIGLSQAFVVVALELSNMAFLLKTDTILDIVIIFAAMRLISDFDEYMYLTV